MPPATVHPPADPGKPGPSLHSLQEATYASVIAAVMVALIYFGRPLLVPIALSVLLAFALAPVAEFLRRLRLGRIVAVILAVTMAVLLITGMATFIGTQLAWLAVSLPQYQHNIVDKIQSVEGSATNNGFVRGAISMFDNLSEQIANVPLPNNTNELQSKTTAQRTDPAMRVVIEQPPPGPLELLQNIAGPLLEPLANLTIIMIFVIFMLLQKEDLRDRFIMLAGPRDLQRTTLAIDDGAERLSRYLLLQTAVNTVFGLLVGLGLWAAGVPNPALWGLISAMFRFVPYVGVPIAALVPLALSLAVDPGWAMMFWTLGVYVVLEFDHRPGDRAMALWPQHGSVGIGRGGGGGFLDVCVGACRASAVDAADHVPRRDRPPCRPTALSGCDAGRCAANGPGGELLSAHARGRS